MGALFVEYQAASAMNRPASKRSDPSLLIPKELATDSELSSAYRLMLRLGAVAGVPGGTRGSWPSRYGTALAALAVATLVRTLLDPILGNRAAYGMYVLATVFVVWRAGLGPALATVACGAMLARYLFEDPRGTFAMVTEANQSALVMSLTIGVVTALLCESLRVTAINNARLYQMARRADARKDEFLAMLAHELRNPLAPIRNAIYSLNIIGPTDPRMAELHQMIARQTDHLVYLVNDLLDVARITQGKIELKRADVEFKPLIKAAIEVVQPQLQAKPLTLHVSLPAANIILSADPVRLTQVFTNLLDNAAKYTEPGGQIWLSADMDGDQLVVRVRDTGIGLAPEACERIFDLFEQANHSMERSTGGLGIGLTLVRSLVQMHGGSVIAKSAGLGLGSEFVVRLHTISAIEVSPPMLLPAQQRTGESISLPPLRVLVVDDSHAAANSLANVLKLWKLTIQISHDGFSALEAARTFKPDVVLADLGMPKMHGYQLAKELRRLPGLENVALIAITGYGQVADLERSQTAGFAHHLVKPIDPDQLKQILAAVAVPAA